ncbi:MAG: hypothetical protein JWP97_2061 [Labilithrix sp.]|nr:hypothetical protein [Labilithrix sp.]
MWRRSGAPKELEFSYYTDHYRHLRYAWESLRIGPAIYVTDMTGMPVLGDAPAYTWTNTAYLYPPGALLFFMPLAQLAYRGLVPLDAAATLLVFVFGVAAVWSSLRIWRFGKEDSQSTEGTILWGLYAVCCLAHALGWGLHGQYDALVVAVLVLAATARTVERRLLFLAVAFFFKFQALLVLPFFARDLLGLVGLRGRRVLREPQVAVAGFLTLVTLVIAGYLGAIGALSPHRQSPLRIHDLFGHDRTTLGALGFTVAFSVLASSHRRWQAAGTALWVFGTFAKLTLLQGWYVVYLYPTALFVERRSRPWVVAWVLGFVYLIHWLPDLFREVSSLLVLRP